MVLPVTCDCKKKLASMLKGYAYAPLHIMAVPAAREADEAVEEFLESLYALIPVLEEATSQPITYASLTGAVKAVGLDQNAYSKFLSLKGSGPPVIRGTHAMAAMHALSYMPIEDWTQALWALNAELEVRRREGFTLSRKPQPRIMVTGSPIVFPNIKAPLLIDEMGGALVADETCMGDRYLYDPISIADNSFDGIMRAIANRYIRPCTCPTFTDSRQRVYKIQQMIRSCGVEGVIYHVLRGCLVYDFEFQMLAEELGAMDIPVIRIESDYSEEDVEQMKVRIEAFVELLKLKNHNTWGVIANG